MWSSAADYAALIAGFAMIYNAWNIGNPAVRELLDETVDIDLEEQVGSRVLQNAQVKNINLCIVRKS